MPVRARRAEPVPVGIAEQLLQGLALDEPAVAEQGQGGPVVGSLRPLGGRFEDVVDELFVRHAPQPGDAGLLGPGPLGPQACDRLLEGLRLLRLQGSHLRRQVLDVRHARHPSLRVRKGSSTHAGFVHARRGRSFTPGGRPDEKGARAQTRTPRRPGTTPAGLDGPRGGRCRAGAPWAQAPADRAIRRGAKCGQRLTPGVVTCLYLTHLCDFLGFGRRM